MVGSSRWRAAILSAWFRCHLWIVATGATRRLPLTHGRSRGCTKTISSVSWHLCIHVTLQWPKIHCWNKMWHNSWSETSSRKHFCLVMIVLVHIYCTRKITSLVLTLPNSTQRVQVTPLKAPELQHLLSKPNAPVAVSNDCGQ